MIRERRLRKPADFAAVYKRGRAVSNEVLALRSLPTDQPASRIGFSVSKRVGTAVVRNRVKRRLRAIVIPLTLVLGRDIVVVARVAAAERDFTALRGAMLNVLQRARLLPPSQRPADAEPHRNPE